MERGGGGGRDTCMQWRSIFKKGGGGEQKYSWSFYAKQTRISSGYVGYLRATLKNVV